MKIGFSLWLWIVKRRVVILIIFLSAGAIYAGLHFLYPRTTLTVAVQRIDVDKNGKLTGIYGAIQDHLAQYGVKLNYKFQEDDAKALPRLEWAIGNSEIDFVLHEETGAQLAKNVSSQFRSVGILWRNLVYFYARNGVEVVNLRDLKGKKIILWTSPEGKEEQPFSSKYFKPSIYSNDWIYHQIFTLAGVNSDNSTIINAWPHPMTTQMEWDVLITHLGIPAADSVSNQTRTAVLRGDIRLANIRDVQSIAAWRSAYDTYVLPESALSITANVPQRETRLLSTYFSLAVKKDLDPSLVLMLAEALQKICSFQSAESAKNEFPNFSIQGMFEPHPVAQQFYREGKPFLTNYVSPAFAAFLMKLALVFIPLITVLWPITNLVPKIYSFYVKHKITHWYIDLELIDKTFEHADSETRKKYAESIDAIRQGIAEMRLPIMHTHYAQELFAARAHVDLIRRKINELMNLEAAKQARTSTSTSA